MDAPLTENAFSGTILRGNSFPGTFFHGDFFSGGGQNLERPNVERPIFRKFETSYIKITKVELFDFFCFKIYFLFLRLFELFGQILNIC